MKNRTVTVFGGTGFLGRCIVRHLRAAGASVRVASRHRHRARAQFGTADPELEAIAADVQSEESVASAVADAYGVVNAVSLYVERGNETFPSVHVQAAERVANQARRQGVERLAHVSGIGADPTSGSPYIRSRGEGELLVRAAFPGATIIRPAVMFGPDDGFYKELLETITRRAEIRRVLVPVPFSPLGRPGVCGGGAASSACDTKPSGSDADGQCRLAGDAWIR